MKRWLFILPGLVWGMPALCFAASVTLTAPNYLPINTSCSYYSPEVRIDYSGLESQRYTLKIWLLQSPRQNPSPPCATNRSCEAGFCERIITIDNSGGGSSTGQISIAENFDVYNYTEFDWVVRLYNSVGTQVAWTEQYTTGTYNRAPKLNDIGDKTVYVGQLLEFYVSGTDSDGNALAYTAYNLPSGAVFDAGTGRITWTPSTTGIYSGIKFRVTDNGEGNLYDDELIEITVSQCPLPSTPSSPSPSNGATGVPTNTTLSWTSSNADSYDVYFGTSSSPPYVGNMTSANYPLSGLSTNTTYYWKIVAKNNCGNSTPGPVWSFTTSCITPGSFSYLSPSNGLTNQPRDGDLDWRDSSGATSYDVYFGTTNPPPFLTNKTSSYHDLGTLNYGTTYYWKIVAKNSCGDTYAGSVWSFTTTIVGTNVDRAYQHLYEVMDKYHNSFYVYSDQDAGGNHGYPSGWMGDISGLNMDTAWEEGRYNGNTCIKNTWITPVNQPWVGVMWQEPENNWGTIQNGGYDLTGATELSFWAQGEEGGEPVKFIVGGIQGEYPDSIQPQISTEVISLTKQWGKYTINLTGKNLTNVIGLFGWVTSTDPVFYLDDIQYNKSRPDELTFLESYETLAVTDPDKYIRNASFVYDNALVLLAFLARGNNDDLRRAGILADAFVYAMNNDRYYTDGRLRNAYMSGDLIDHLTRKARIPGWWDSIDKKWYEDEFQVSTYTGNLAWVMIALLNYYKKVEEEQYLDAAITLGEWIERETKDARCAGGYTGGYKGWEPKPTAEHPEGQTKIEWKSTEHNIDVYVAFMLLYEITGDETWEGRALHAKNFVEAMWSGSESHFWTGTYDDGCTINKTNDPNDPDNPIKINIPLDIQAWALMAFDSYNSALNWAENNCYIEHHSFKGFDFNNDKDGVWFEGTAQMAVAYQINRENSKSDSYIEEIRKAQTSATNDNGKGIVAACHDGVTTGFDWEYFNRLHIGATAWYIFAERGHNPYWGMPLATIPGDCNGDGQTTIDEVQKAINQYLEVSPAQPCNDLNGNGQVTIDELQKVINAFLRI